MSAPILTTSDLAIGYGTKTVASGITLSVESGRLIALLGANGRGKSTLLRTLAGAQPPLSGTVEIEGKEIDQWRPRELARLVGLVYTDRTLAGGLTVEELVALGRQPHTGFFGRLSADDREAVASAMRMTGIYHKSREYVARLSDGERQKAMIARALAQATPIIMMDEPTAFLDAASRIELMELLHRLCAEESKAIILSTHDVAPAIALSDTLWLFVDSADPGAQSRIVSGTPAELSCSPDGLPALFAGRAVVYDPASGDFRPLT